MNPFDDNADDFVFVAKAKGSSASPWSDEQTSASSGRYGEFDDGLGAGEFGGSRTGYSGGFGEDDDGMMGYQNLQNQIETRQNNMIESTQRSLGLMYESEEVGNETAHELLRQGEQLRRTEQKLDTINQDLTTSQKHINSIKSVFGGIRNYFGKKPVETIPEHRREPSKLESTVSSSPSNKDRDHQEEHPAFRIRDPNPPSYGYGGASSGTAGAGYDDSGFGQPRQQTRSMQQFDDKLNTNLDELSKGLGRLKNLGIGLADELDKQDDDIERITGKAEKADDKLLHTNKEINRILRK